MQLRRFAMLGFWMFASVLAAAEDEPKQIRVGIIGLDTSHATAFTKIFKDPKAPADVAGCRVVAAYPHGSPDIKSSVERIPKYTEEAKELGVEIVDSIATLLQKVDAVLLETNDGRLHLEQARQVLKAGKPLFIDKPMAASLKDVILIFEEAKQAGVPVWSSSSLRYGKSTQEVRGGSIGKVTKCETTSPAELEPTHPDLFWYGIHGVESLFTVMGTGCQSVVRSTTDNRITVTGKWQGDRTGVFRAASDYSGTAVGEKGETKVAAYEGYRPLVVEIVKFFRTGTPPVTAEETIEIYAFMEAADESKRQNGAEVTLSSVLEKARASEKSLTPSELCASITKAIPLLETSAREFTKQRECFSCHHQTLPMLAMKRVRINELTTSAEEFRAQAEWTAKFLEKNKDRFREGKGTGGQADTAGYALWALATADYAANEITDSVAEYLLLRHKDRDHWSATSKRPPTEASDFTTTFLAIQGLARYANAEQKERAKARIEQARQWLASTEAKDTEDQVFRLRGLRAADADEQEIKQAAERLLSRQREDGGWNQVDMESSDAYATASALAALVEVGGMSASSDFYQRGLRFLLKTQQEDGTWQVSTRSKPIQEYFESGFPHGTDQFISISATAWSVVALSHGLTDAAAIGK